MLPSGLCFAVGSRFVAKFPVAESDHLRVAHERQVAIYRAMTPQQRLKQAMRMDHTMRELMAAGFRDRNPTWKARREAGGGGTNSVCPH
jgi:hypothetical protein